MSPAYIARWRFALVFLTIAAGYCGIIVQLYHLQISDGPRIARMAENARERVQVQRARRGDISDCRGNLLAATRPVIELGVDPEGIRPEDEAKLPKLAELTGVPLAKLRELCTPGTYTSNAELGEVRKVRWRKISDAIGDTLYDEIRALGIPAVYGNRKYVRDYPSGIAAAHMLGFVNKEEAAVTGVEYQLDYYLRGQDGWREIETDARRKEMAQFEKRSVAPRDGLNVEMTLDLVIQDMVDREAEKLSQTYHPDSVVIIVSDPRSGDILGLANWPVFNPNEYWKSPVDSLRNRAVTDVYEPGSTFKIVPVAGALEEHLVTPDTLVDCKSPTAEYNGRTVRLPREDHAMGIVPVSSVVAKSSNRGSARLAMKLGDERFLDYVHSFGFGKASGSFGTAEVRGLVNPLDKWDGLTISRMPMGHSIGVTAVQMHYAMSAVANGGVLMQPRIVSRVYDNNGETVFNFSPRVRNRVMSQQTAHALAAMLEKVPTKEGTAVRAEIKGYQVAGKTGTSQKIENGQYSHSKHVATFTGFFPASDPQIAVTVVIDNGKRPDGGVSYGGVVAAPAFKEIAQQIIQYLAMEPPGTSGIEMLATTDAAR
ncbi:MAG: penicillin-binding protein 2 [Opitutales bacterium]|nr:penicillin-binding protein 2 [Opitutales bacterium]